MQISAVSRSRTSPTIRTSGSCLKKARRAVAKVNPTCDACGHATGAYRAYDGPAYFTVLLVGHLFIAPIVLMPFIREWSPVLLCATLLPDGGLIPSSTPLPWASRTRTTA